VYLLLNLAQKEELVSVLHRKFEEKKILILVDYKGLNVPKMTELRAKLREAGVELIVVKNTLLARAAENTDVALIRDQLAGPNAIAMSYGDPVLLAKVLNDFSKENAKLEIKAGVLSGQALTFNDIKALSDLPSREVLLATVLSAMNAVPTSLVRALNNVPERLVYVLQAIKEQKEAA
jgi:large subunit ribosomal protein L10